MRRRMATRVKRRRRAAAAAGLATALLVGVGSGAAYGYLSNSGSGIGSVSVGTMKTVVMATISGETPDVPLQPGASGEVILEVSNPNTHGAHLVSVVGDGPISVSGGASGCTAGTSGVSFTDQTGLSDFVPATTTLVIRLSGAASMAVASVSTCQGATFSIPVTITVRTP